MLYGYVDIESLVYSCYVSISELMFICLHSLLNRCSSSIMNIGEYCFATSISGIITRVYEALFVFLGFASSIMQHSCYVSLSLCYCFI